ncbi:hypothetical protein DV515_00004977 [Chloebia gouldiae]|uniref:Uncharacterized protein n=1 Tax=Chloebia gouldiae TaxID=44316 RepID=A0A3L8SPC4_CHLGU|nr:hypothetical protein DV515_00004977 [Chloebia gouldiae]
MGSFLFPPQPASLQPGEPCLATRAVPWLLAAWAGFELTIVPLVSLSWVQKFLLEWRKKSLHKNLSQRQMGLRDSLDIYRCSEPHEYITCKWKILQEDNNIIRTILQEDNNNHNAQFKVSQEVYIKLSTLTSTVISSLWMKEADVFRDDEWALKMYPETKVSKRNHYLTKCRLGLGIVVMGRRRSYIKMQIKRKVRLLFVFLYLLSQDRLVLNGVSLLVAIARLGRDLCNWKFTKTAINRTAELQVKNCSVIYRELEFGLGTGEITLKLRKWEKTYANPTDFVVSFDDTEVVALFCLPLSRAKDLPSLHRMRISRTCHREFGGKTLERKAQRPGYRHLTVSYGQQHCKFCAALPATVLLLKNLLCFLACLSIIGEEKCPSEMWLLHKNRDPAEEAVSGVSERELYGSAVAMFTFNSCWGTSELSGWASEAMTRWLALLQPTGTKAMCKISDSEIFQHQRNPKGVFLNLTKEADRTDLESKLLVLITKVIDHHINYGHLVYFGPVITSLISTARPLDGLMSAEIHFSHTRTLEMIIQADRAERSQFSNSCNFQLSLELYIYPLWIPKCELTVWEVGVAELQIFAGPGWVILSAHGKLHVLNVLLQGIQGAKDLLHAIGIIQNIITSIRQHIIHHVRVMQDKNSYLLEDQVDQVLGWAEVTKTQPISKAYLLSFGTWVSFQSRQARWALYKSREVMLKARNAPETLWARLACRSLWPNWPCFSRSPFCTRFTLQRTDQEDQVGQLHLKDLGHYFSKLLEDFLTFLSLKKCMKRKAKDLTDKSSSPDKKDTGSTRIKYKVPCMWRPGPAQVSVTALGWNCTMVPTDGQERSSQTWHKVLEANVCSRELAQQSGTAHEAFCQQEKQLENASPRENIRTWGPREASRTFVTFLPKHPLLTSWAWLSITSLFGKNEEQNNHSSDDNRKSSMEMTGKQLQKGSGSYQDPADLVDPEDPATNTHPKGQESYRQLYWQISQMPITMIHLVTIFSRRTTRTSRTRKSYRALYSITSSWTLGTFFTLVLKKIKQATLS